MSGQESMITTFAQAGSDFQIQHVMFQGEPWFRGKDVATTLGYAHTKQAIAKNVEPDDRQQLKELVQSDTHTYNERCTIYINRDGLKSLVLKSQKPEAISFAKHLGIRVDTKYLRKEIEIVSFLQQFLTSLQIPFEFQKTVGPYRVDIYLPQQKIAVEIDEFGHKGRDASYEKAREVFIRGELKCEVLRVNSDDTGFNLATFVADVTRMLFQRDTCFQ